jgi:ubiquinone/menaquinone biosynthesis C-methylase UbiE
MTDKVRTYDAGEMEINFNRENNYWWFVGRRNIFKRLLENEFPNKRSLSFLDAGCGTGATLKAFSYLGRGVGCDISIDAHLCCRKRGLDCLVRADLSSLPFENEKFDFVLIMDVIYGKWVKDENSVLREVNRVLKKNGKLFITEGAFMLLMSKHNKRVGAVRRYTKRVMKVLLRESGFFVKRISYWNMFLFPIFFAVALIDRVMDDSSRGLSKMDKDINPLVNKMFTVLLDLESRMMSFIDLPLGASIVAVGYKEG